MHLLKSNSGAGFAAVVAQKAKAHAPPIHLEKQILLVPTTIHTAARHAYRKEVDYAPGAGRIEWYESLLYPNEKDTESPDASPLLASLSQLASAPDTWIGLAEVDALLKEGIAYAEALREAGVKVDVKLYERKPHMLLPMDKALKIPVVSDVVEVVKACIH